MPTTSQWKILHSMLKSGRLKQATTDQKENGENKDGQDNKREEDNTVNETKPTPTQTLKEAPKRRNSFHFSKNARGILTIVCRPKSVPVKFGTPRNGSDNSEGGDEHLGLSHDQTSDSVCDNSDTNYNTTTNNSNTTNNNNTEDSQATDAVKSVSAFKNAVILSKNFSRESLSSAKSCVHQSTDNVTNNGEATPEVGSQLGYLSEATTPFPDLLDPNNMMKNRRSSPAVPRRLQSASSIKRRGSVNVLKSPDITKVNKSVTFNRPSSNTIYDHVEDDGIIEDVEDEDNMGITLENVDKILPKFNNPLTMYGGKNKIIYNSHDAGRQSMPTPLRPLRSAPALRRVTKAISIFNTQNLKRCKTSMSLTDTSAPLDQNDMYNDDLTVSCHGYRIKHTTFAYKGITWNKDKQIIFSQWKPQNQNKTTEGVPTDSSNNGEGFEPYVIHNGRLVRRGSISGMKGGNIAAIRNTGAEGALRRNSSKASILGKDEATTLATVCDAFIIRGGSKMDQDKGDPTGFSNSNRLFSRPSSTREVSRWSMATQSIITRPVSAISIAAASGSTASAFVSDQTKECVTDVEEIELPEAVQQDLHKLGFRKQKAFVKGKRKKSERSKKSGKQKGSSEEKQPKEQDFKGIINLKQDPVLLKVQKKNRNIGTFTCEPTSQPTAVCFEIRGSNPSHGEVMSELRRLQRMYPEVMVDKLQFDYRALVNNIHEMDNRWIITTNSVSSRNRLAGSCIRLYGHDHQLRRYDDVITTEYQQYKRMMDFVKMMNSRLGIKEK